MIRTSSLLRIIFWSKPRASGDDPTRVLMMSNSVSVNPARAGMIPSLSKRLPRSLRKPRASGDDPRPFICAYSTLK